MSRLTRDGTAEPVSRDQILRHARGQGNINFPCSADHEQDWQPHPVDPYSAICDDHTYTYIHATDAFEHDLTMYPTTRIGLRVEINVLVSYPVHYFQPLRYPRKVRERPQLATPRLLS